WPRRLPGHRHVGEGRGDGLLASVEFVADNEDRASFDPSQKVGIQIAAALAERGVLGRAMPQGDIRGFAPARCLIPAEADTIVKALSRRRWAPSMRSYRPDNAGR